MTALAWPVVVSMLTYTAVGLVDAALGGRLGTGPLAALALGGSAAQLTTVFGGGVLRGARILAAHATGARDHEAALQVGWQSLWLAAALGAAVALASLTGPALFTALGASEDVAREASAFYRIRALGAAPLYLLVGLTAWRQGRGDTRTPMRAALLANAVTLALAPLLTLGLGRFDGFGLAGTAMGFNLGSAAGGAWLLSRSLADLAEGARQRGRRFLGPDLASLRRIFGLGAPLGLHVAMDVGSYAAFAALLAQTGEVGLAAHVLVIRLVSVSFMPGFAISEAAGVLVGQGLGARSPAQAGRAWRASRDLAFVLMGFFALIYAAVPDLLLAPFGVAPEVAALARRILLIAAAIQLFDAYATIAQGALAGAGDTRFGMVVSLVACWGVKLPLGAALALGLGWGAAGAWLGILVEIIGAAAAFHWRIGTWDWGRPAPLRERPLVRLALWRRARVAARVRAA